MAKLDKKAVYKVFTDVDAFATTLHAVCFLNYGEELYKIDSLELYARIQDDFGVIIIEENESKLMAMIVAVSTPYFFQDLEVFKATCTTIASGDVDLEIEDPTITEVFWTLYEVGLNAEEIEFAPSIQAFLNSLVEDEAEDIDVSEKELMQEVDEIIQERAKDLEAELRSVGFSETPLMPKI